MVASPGHDRHTRFSSRPRSRPRNRNRSPLHLTPAPPTGKHGTHGTDGTHGSSPTSPSPRPLPPGLVPPASPLPTAPWPRPSLAHRQVYHTSPLLSSALLYFSSCPAASPRSASTGALSPLSQRTQRFHGQRDTERQKDSWSLFRTSGKAAAHREGPFRSGRDRRQVPRRGDTPPTMGYRPCHTASCTDGRVVPQVDAPSAIACRRCDGRAQRSGAF